MLTSACWGTVCGVLTYSIVAILWQHDLMPETLLCFVREPLQKVEVSAIWGALWGTMWGMCRRPAVGRSRGRFSGMLTGVLLGAALGGLTSTFLGMLPGSPSAALSGTWLERLQSLAWDAPLPLMREILRKFVASLQLHALSGVSMGMIFGALWGGWKR